MQIHWISALYGCGLWSDGASSTKAIQYVTVKDSFITAALKIGTSMDLSMEEQLQLKMSNYQSSEMRIIQGDREKARVFETLNFCEKG